jgi:hypothetical protein
MISTLGVVLADHSVPCESAPPPPTPFHLPLCPLSSLSPAINSFCRPPSDRLRCAPIRQGSPRCRRAHARYLPWYPLALFRVLCAGRHVRVIDAGLSAAVRAHLLTLYVTSNILLMLAVRHHPSRHLFICALLHPDPKRAKHVQGDRPPSAPSCEALLNILQLLGDYRQRHALPIAPDTPEHGLAALLRSFPTSSTWGASSCGHPDASLSLASLWTHPPPSPASATTRSVFACSILPASGVAQHDTPRVRSVELLLPSSSFHTQFISKQCCVSDFVEPTLNQELPYIVRRVPVFLIFVCHTSCF